MPMSWLERRQRLPPALPCLLTPAPQLYTLTDTHVGSLHLLGSHRVECSQTKPKYVSLWVLLMCVSIAVVNNAQSSTCLLFCIWENRCKTCLISLHLSVSFTHSDGTSCRMKKTAGWGSRAPARQEGKGQGDFQKGQRPQRNGETEIWKVTHLSTGKRRKRIKTVP